jgi:hypothetical protein
VVGRSPYLQPVHVMAPTSLIGQIVPVRITKVGSNSLSGTLHHPSPPDSPDQGSPDKAPEQALAGSGD